MPDHQRVSQEAISAKQAGAFLESVAPGLTDVLEPLRRSFGQPLPPRGDLSSQATAKRIDYLVELLRLVSIDSDVDARDIPLGQLLAKVSSLRPATAAEAQEVEALARVVDFPVPEQRCVHCGRPIEAWESRDAERAYGRRPLYIHSDLVDGATDSTCTGIDCRSDEADGEVAEPSRCEPIVCGPPADGIHRPEYDADMAARISRERQDASDDAIFGEAKARGEEIARDLKAKRELRELLSSADETLALFAANGAQVPAGYATPEELHERLEAFLVATSEKGGSA